MNDISLALRRLESIARAASEPSTEAERAGLFAGARWLIADLEADTREIPGSGYLREKLGSLRWHIGALLGYDVTNGHESEQHLVWVLGELTVLRENLQRAGELG